MVQDVALFERLTQIVSRPKARGMELIESGGITPTSVTTAVMLDGGVRS